MPNQSRAVVGCDLGNAIGKLIIVNGEQRTRRAVYPHAVVVASGMEFSDAQMRSRSSDGNDLFRYVRKSKTSEIDQPYFVGQSAYRSSVVKPLSGALKYGEDYYAPYAMRGLLDLFPNGHDNLHLIGMFPPIDSAYTDTLKNSLGGKHTVVTPDGRMLHYVVREVTVIDEPVGGFYHTLLDYSGKPLPQTLYTKNRILIVDIGGRVTTMTPASKKGEIDYHRVKGIEAGINDVQDNFIAEMRHRYPQFKELRSMNIDQVRDALYTGKWIGGQTIDVREAKKAACTKFLNSVSALYKDVGGALSYNHILITGGGGGLLRRELFRDVLNHDNVILADPNYKEMHLANVRGAAKMALASGFVRK